MVRAAAAPEIPTVKESGIASLKNYEVDGWYGLAAPAGTPSAISDRVLSAVQASMTPDLVDALRNQGAEPMNATTARFGAFVSSEIKKWGEVVRAVDLKAE